MKCTVLYQFFEDRSSLKTHNDHSLALRYLPSFIQTFLSFDRLHILAAAVHWYDAYPIRLKKYDIEGIQKILGLAHSKESAVFEKMYCPMECKQCASYPKDFGRLHTMDCVFILLSFSTLTYVTDSQNFLTKDMI